MLRQPLPFLVCSLVYSYIYIYTLQGINISHLGKRNIIFKMPFLGDMLVSWRVIIHTHKRGMGNPLTAQFHINKNMTSEANATLGSLRLGFLKFDDALYFNNGYAGWLLNRSTFCTFIMLSEVKYSIHKRIPIRIKVAFWVKLGKVSFGNLWPESTI